MKLIIGDRQSGKTTKLIHLASANNKYIVVHTHSEAKRVFNQANEMGIKIHLPITFDEFLQNQYAGKNISSFYIDNAEILLKRLTSVKIAGITMSIYDPDGLHI